MAIQRSPKRLLQATLGTHGVCCAAIFVACIVVSLISNYFPFNQNHTSDVSSSISSNSSHSLILAKAALLSEYVSKKEIDSNKRSTKRTTTIMRSHYEDLYKLYKEKSEDERYYINVPNKTHTYLRLTYANSSLIPLNEQILLCFEAEHISQSCVHLDPVTMKPNTDLFAVGYVFLHVGIYSIIDLTMQMNSNLNTTSDETNYIHSRSIVRDSTYGMFIGLGGCSIHQWSIDHIPKLYLDTAELFGFVKDIAAPQLGCDINNPRLNVAIMDGIEYLSNRNQSNTLAMDYQQYGYRYRLKKYDFIHVDACAHHKCFPDSMNNQQFIDLVKQNLTPTGVFVVYFWRKDHRRKQIWHLLGQNFDNIIVDKWRYAYTCICFDGQSLTIDQIIQNWKSIDHHLALNSTILRNKIGKYYHISK